MSFIKYLTELFNQPEDRLQGQLFQKNQTVVINDVNSPLNGETVKIISNKNKYMNEYDVQLSNGNIIRVSENKLKSAQTQTEPALATA